MIYVGKVETENLAMARGGVWITAPGVAGVLITLRLVGALQLLEWALSTTTLQR
jgi:CHASE2 domain-containing sensor protein